VSGRFTWRRHRPALDGGADEASGEQARHFGTQKVFERSCRARAALVFKTRKANGAIDGQDLVRADRSRMVHLMVLRITALGPKRSATMMPTAHRQRAGSPVQHAMRGFSRWPQTKTDEKSSVFKMRRERAK